MTARWMCITALGALSLLTACDRGKAPADEPDPAPSAPADRAAAPEPTEAAEARPEQPAVREPPPREPTAPDPPAHDPPAQDAGSAPPPEDDPPRGDKTAAAQGNCGGVGGLRCKKSQKCRYGAGEFAPPHPDAMGSCVDETYCDAPADCDGLMHVMTVGQWACETNRCAWKTQGGSGPM